MEMNMKHEFWLNLTNYFRNYLETRKTKIEEFGGL